MLRSSTSLAHGGALASARAAIVHDWFQGYGGAERVVDVMRTRVFDDAAPPDIYTFHAARELLPPGLVATIRGEARVTRAPGIRQRGHDPGRWRYLLPYMPRYFRRLDLEPYDLVIASSWAFALQARPRPDAAHVCYCYTPLRYVWLPEVEGGRTRGIARVALQGLSRRLRRLDLEASRRPDVYIAISQAVRARIQRFYGRDALVVHPPVEVGEFDPRGEKRSGHFLWVNRLVPYKKPDLVLEAFRGLPYTLTMVGLGPLEDRLRRDLPPNVELRGWLSREELVRLNREAGGFVHVGEEDFGISMVEALASGTPVIALARGGALDIVRDGEDGVLLEEADVTSLRAAVRRVAEASWDAERLHQQALEFSTDRFVERFGRVVEDALAAR